MIPMLCLVLLRYIKKRRDEGRNVGLATQTISG
jgi:hypothetical protein